MLTNDKPFNMNTIKYILKFNNESRYLSNSQFKLLFQCIKYIKNDVLTIPYIMIIDNTGIIIEIGYPNSKIFKLMTITKFDKYLQLNSTGNIALY